MPLSNTELVAKIDRVITGHQEFVSQQIGWLTSTENTVTLSDPYQPSLAVTVKTPVGLQADYDALLGPTNSALTQVQAALADADQLVADANAAATTAEGHANSAASSATLANTAKGTAEAAAVAAQNSEAAAASSLAAMIAYDTAAEENAAAAAASATAASTSASAAATSETAAAASAAAAAASEGSVAADAATASTAATDATTAATTATTAATNAATSETNAAASATAAASSAADADASYQAMVSYETTSATNATNAANSASAAATSATNAANSATAAAASEASVSADATAATTAATNAAASESAAATSATNAAASATTASTAASTASDMALQAEEFRDETSDLHDATAAIAADIGDAITAARASTALSLSGSYSPFVKRELMMDFNEEENALPVLGSGPSYFWVTTGPRFAQATHMWDSDQFFGMLNMSLYSDTGSNASPDSRWVYCPEELGYKPQADYSSVTSMFRFAVDYEFDQEMLQKTTLYFGLNCGLEENNLFQPASSPGAWVQFEPALIGGVWKYRMRIVARGAGTSNELLLDDSHAIPLDANVRTFQLSVSTTGAANQQLISLNYPTTTGSWSRSMFVTGVGGFPLDLALRPFTGMTRTAALVNGNETNAIVISDYFYVSSGTDNRAQIGPASTTQGEFDFDGSRFMVTLPNVYGYATFNWQAQGATPGNGQLMIGTYNDGDTPQARMLFEDGDGRVTTLAQNVTFTPDYDGPGSGTMTIEHGTLAAAGTDATFDGVTVGSLKVGTAAGGGGASTTLSLQQANGNYLTRYLNTAGTTQAGVAFNAGGTALETLIGGVVVGSWSSGGLTVPGVVNAGTGSFASLNTTNDNSGTVLLGRYSAAVPHSYHTLRAGSTAYKWQTADGVDRMSLNDTMLELPGGGYFKGYITGTGTSASPAEQELLVARYAAADDHHSGIYTVNEFNNNHSSYLRFKTTSAANVTATRMTLTETGINNTAIGVTTPAAGVFSSAAVNAAGSAYAAISFGNSNGSSWVGKEAGDSSWFGATPHAMVVRSDNSKPVEIFNFTTKIASFNSAGVDVTGNLVTSGTVRGTGGYLHTNSSAVAFIPTGAQSLYYSDLHYFVNSSGATPGAVQGLGFFATDGTVNGRIQASTADDGLNVGPTTAHNLNFMRGGSIKAKVTTTGMSMGYAGAAATTFGNRENQLNINFVGLGAVGAGGELVFSGTGTNPVYATVSGFAQGADANGIAGGISMTTKGTTAAATPTERLRIDQAGQIYLWIPALGMLRAIDCGPPDSAGTGYRSIRISN
jgi:hypothetical protein